jgi:hypothetical protein
MFVTDVPAALFFFVSVMITCLQRTFFICTLSTGTCEIHIVNKVPTHPATQSMTQYGRSQTYKLAIDLPQEPIILLASPFQAGIKLCVYQTRNLRG